MYSINSLGKKIARGYIVRDDTGDIIPFQFNPTDFSEKRKVNYVIIDSPGAVYPEINYINQDKRSFVLNLKFNEFVKTNLNKDTKYYVEGIISKLESLTQPSDTLVRMRSGAKTFTEPPTCRLVFGKAVRKVKVAEVNLKKTEFDKNLACVILEADVEFLEIV